MNLMQKSSTNQMQQDIKKIIHHDQEGFIPQMQAQFNTWKSTPIIHSTNRIRAKAKESSQWEKKRHLIKVNISSLKNTLNKLRMQRNFFSLTKDICEKPTADIILNGERQKAFLLRSETRERYLFLPLLVNTVHEDLARENLIKSM